MEKKWHDKPETRFYDLDAFQRRVLRMFVAD